MDMNKEQIKAERKTLVLSLLAGLCGNATLAVLTSSAVAFSIFPVIAFALAVYCLYQEYLSKPMAEARRDCLCLFPRGCLWLLCLPARAGARHGL